MTSKQASEVAIKSFSSSIQERDAALSARLADGLHMCSYRSIGQMTGYNSETVRRYLAGGSKIPADFLGQVCKSFKGIDAYRMMGVVPQESLNLLKTTPTHILINEVSERIRLIEDNTVSSILVRSNLPTEDQDL